MFILSLAYVDLKSKLVLALKLQVTMIKRTKVQSKKCASTRTLRAFKCWKLNGVPICNHRSLRIDILEVPHKGFEPLFPGGKPDVLGH